MRKQLLFGVLILGLGLALSAEDGQDSGEKPIHKSLLQNIHILDVHNTKISPPRNILIEKERIKTVGTGASQKLENIRKIDCTGMYAVPGLFDCHTHLAFLRTMGKTTLKEMLARFVKHGITQVRDVGGPVDLLNEISQAIAKGEMQGPDFYYTGPMLEKSPLHWADHNKILPGFTVPVDSEKDVDRIISELIKGGARLVKTFNKFDPEVYRYLIGECRKHSLRIVHDPGRPFFQMIPMEKAIEMGVTSIEHAMSAWHHALKDKYKDEYRALLAPTAAEEERNDFRQRMGILGAGSVSPKNLEVIAKKMRDNDVCFCPTLYVMELMARQTAAKEEAEGQERKKRFSEGMIEVGRLIVKEMANQKVKLLVGQDNMNPVGTLIEMRLMNDCGVDEWEIIRGATVYPARWLGEEKRLGSITPGKKANILIVGENPIEDIENIRKIHMVIKNGKIAFHSNKGNTRKQKHD